MVYLFDLVASLPLPHRPVSLPHRPMSLHERDREHAFASTFCNLGRPAHSERNAEFEFAFGAPVHRGPVPTYLACVLDGRGRGGVGGMALILLAAGGS